MQKCFFNFLLILLPNFKFHINLKIHQNTVLEKNVLQLAKSFHIHHDLLLINNESTQKNEKAYFERFFDAFTFLENHVALKMHKKPFYIITCVFIPIKSKSFIFYIFSCLFCLQFSIFRYGIESS